MPSRRAAHLSVQGQNLSPTSSSSLDMDLFSPPEHKFMFRPSALLVCSQLTNVRSNSGVGYNNIISVFVTFQDFPCVPCVSLCFLVFPCVQDMNNT